MPYIDAVCVKGETTVFSSTIEINDNADNFSPLDLNDYSVRIRILGSPVADGKVLIEKLITQNTEIEEIGQIDDPNNGSFTFAITAKDTEVVGLGKHPVKIDLMSPDGSFQIYSLTLGDEHGEYNAIRVVQV